jgi:hypothetical protein
MSTLKGLIQRNVGITRVIREKAERRTVLEGIVPKPNEKEKPTPPAKKD